MSLSNLLLVAGVVALGLALRSCHHRALHRAGTLGIFLASFLAGWLLAGSAWLGVLLAGSWLFLPWIEILTRVRKLRLPADRVLAPRTPPASGEFPAFGDITNEIEVEGFEHVQDAGWEHADHRHFYRIFYCPQQRAQAAICLVEQSGVAFYYLSLLSRPASGGEEFLTWNYPFSYGLRPPPHLHLRRLDGDSDFRAMLVAHGEFLRENEIEAADLAEQAPEQMCEQIRQSMARQISHNVALGLLVRESDNQIRYSARGMVFLWLEFLRDFARLS